MRRKIITTEIIIERFKAVHGNRYDYSLVNYVNAKTKVTIICKYHGEFEQNIYNHLCGKGCPRCSGKNKTTQDIIKEFKSTHGDKYDYSLVEYKNNRAKVKIICKDHGLFEQVTSNHLNKQGCPKCSNELKSITKTSNTKEFIYKSKNIHNNLYDYSKVTYVNSTTNVIINCPIHGDFKQRPDAHLMGRGCQECSLKLKNSKSKDNPAGWSPSPWIKASLKSKRFDSFKVYVIKCYNDNESFYKIGRTFNTVKNRFYSKSSMPYNYEILEEYVFETANEAFDHEAKLKRKHKQFKYLPELFFNGRHECFSQINFDIVK